MADPDENAAFFAVPQAAGFAPSTPADDLLHTAMNSQLSDPSLTETQFLGFNVPEANLHSVNYLWVHPNLDLVSGGVWAWQDVKRSSLAAELFDMRQFVGHGSIGPGDLADYELPMGYRVRILQPLEKIRISYDDPFRRNAFDVTLTAVMPPAMMPSGKHFDQAMRTEGEAVLRGRRHRVDGYTVRDRSWAELRTEEPRAVPPVHWLTAVFGDDFAINMMGIDDPASGPIWQGAFPEAEPLAGVNRGWVWRDGELRRLESMSLATRWDLDAGSPVGHELRITDSGGREFALSATITASCSWNTWSNANMLIGLARWNCVGRVGWGDSQTATWTDFVHHCL